MVTQAFIEFVVAADVVKVGVRGECKHRPFRQRRHRITQGHHAQAGIDQQVAITTAYVPDVTAQIGADMGFGDQGDVIGAGDGLVPAIRYREVYSFTP